MRELIDLQKLERAKPYLVPYIFSENYFRILKLKITGEKLNSNEQHYYNHFIKKKLLGMMELFDLKNKIYVNGKDKILDERLKKAKSILKKVSRKHRNMKVLITGSFLHSKKYKDIDVFVISKFEKVDYRDGEIHVNFLPSDAVETLFFKSISKLCIANFNIDETISEKISLSDILNLYEEVILLIMQKDSYLEELRELVLKSEYFSNKVVLDSSQLKDIVNGIMRIKNPIKIINNYTITKVINASSSKSFKKVLTKFIEKNKIPEKGKKMHPNWEIYNKTYHEALEIVT
jgi:hypothetical protein